jgi:hypothetical protein
MIDDADNAHSPTSRAAYADALIDVLRDIFTDEEIQALAKAKADGRLKILPAKPGDIIYRPEALQFCWVIANVEIYEDEIVFIDDSDNIFRPDDIGKTVFLTREAAEKALSTCNVTKLQCAECNPCCEHRAKS